MVDAKALIAIVRLSQPPQNTTEASRSYAPPFQTPAVCSLVSRLHSQNKPGRGRWDCHRTMHTHTKLPCENLCTWDNIGDDEVATRLAPSSHGCEVLRCSSRELPVYRGDCRGTDRNRALGRPLDIKPTRPLPRSPAC